MCGCLSVLHISTINLTLLLPQELSLISNHYEPTSHTHFNHSQLCSVCILDYTPSKHTLIYIYISIVKELCESGVISQWDWLWEIRFTTAVGPHNILEWKFSLLCYCVCCCLYTCVLHIQQSLIYSKYCYDSLPLDNNSLQPLNITWPCRSNTQTPLISNAIKFQCFFKKSFCYHRVLFAAPCPSISFRSQSVCFVLLVWASTVCVFVPETL